MGSISKTQSQVATQSKGARKRFGVLVTLGGLLCIFLSIPKAHGSSSTLRSGYWGRVFETELGNLYLSQSKSSDLGYYYAAGTINDYAHSDQYLVVMKMDAFGDLNEWIVIDLGDSLTVTGLDEWMER